MKQEQQREESFPEFESFINKLAEQAFYKKHTQGQREESLINFVLGIDFLGTKEFCEKFDYPVPYYTGNTETSAQLFLNVDAKKWRIVKDKAKELKAIDPAQDQGVKTLQEELIEACKYGYKYHATTSFPELSFEDNCKNNFLQRLQAQSALSLHECKDEVARDYGFDEYASAIRYYDKAPYRISEIIDEASKRHHASQSKTPTEGWVSVEERLPDNSRDVLVSDQESDIISMGFFHAHEDCWEVFTSGMDITHWRELPQTPKQ